MKCLLPAVALLVFWGFAVESLQSVHAQEEQPFAAQDEELEAAILARRESAEFEARIKALQEAQTAREAAISALPEVMAIDAELEQLRLRMGDLLERRAKVVESRAEELATLNDEVEAAKQALLAADPVRRLLDSRHPDRQAETGDPAK